jgi:zinc transport system permease protein
MIFGYPPILRGFLALLVAGLAFPLTGVLVIRMNLITLRFALMHGALLGGAVGVAVGINPAASTVALGLLLVAVIGRVARRSGAGLGPITTMFMAVTVAAAAAITYRYNVPARETLAILWGNAYALRPIDLWITAAFSAVVIGLTWRFRRELTALMFDPEIAAVSGLNEALLYYGVLFGVAATVAVAMRLLGALMLDVLLLLPALVSGQLARSVRALFLIAMGAGFVSAGAGFFVSLILDLPASSGVAAVSVLLLATAHAFRRWRYQ